MEQPDESMDERARYTGGWRSGKPVEDPDKVKRWGIVSAKPSEYLIVTRRGQIDRRRSGQGARLWKWPWQAVAIVPTTLQRIEFHADQVTRERVGVRVGGIAVYRIAEPELAFRLLNFTYGEAAHEKLAATLREMFIGASRRLIANLTLDDCLTRRKEAIASFLMTEIAPVVGGSGAADDTTDRGWGVVIDTIEIQDVRITSPQVFAHLQAPYRAEIAARAELAELERARQVALRKAETERGSAEAQLHAARDTRAMKARAEAEAAAVEARAEAEAAQVRAAMAEAAFAEETRALERARARAALVQAAALERRRADAEVDREVREREAELVARTGALEAAQRRRIAEVEALGAADRLQHALVTVGLPQLAAAFKQSFGEIHYTQLGPGDGGPTNPVAAAFTQLLAVARAFGLDPAALTRRPPVTGTDGS